MPVVSLSLLLLVSGSGLSADPTETVFVMEGTDVEGATVPRMSTLFVVVVNTSPTLRVPVHGFHVVPLSKEYWGLCNSVGNVSVMTTFFALAGPALATVIV